MTIAHLWTFDAEFFGLTIDALATGALAIDGLIERAGAVEGNAHVPTSFPIGVDVSAFAFEELRMIAGFAGCLRNKQGATKALRTVAVCMSELKRRNHTPAFVADGNGIDITGGVRMSVSIEKDGTDAAVASSAFINIPGIKSSIRRDMGGELVERNDALFIEGAEIGDIVLVEGLGEFCQDDIAIVGNRGSSHLGAIPPKVFFLLFLLLWRGESVGSRSSRRGRSVGFVEAMLVGTAFDAKRTVGITSRDARFVIAILDVGTRIIFFDPGVNMLHVESDRFPHAGDLGVQRGDGGSKRSLQQATIQVAQLLTKPVAAGKSGINSEAVELGRVKDEMETELDHQERMFEQEAPQIGGISQTFIDT